MYGNVSTVLKPPIGKTRASAFKLSTFEVLLGGHERGVSREFERSSIPSSLLVRAV